MLGERIAGERVVSEGERSRKARCYSTSDRDGMWWDWRWRVRGVVSDRHLGG